MDANNRLQEINIAMAPNAKNDERRRLVRSYEMMAKDPRELIDLDDDGDIVKLRGMLNNG